MSRSGYLCDHEWGEAIDYLWRGAVQAGIKGRRGQKLLRELLAGLDAMPAKRLIAGKLEAAGEYCALGVVGAQRGLNMSTLDPENPVAVGVAFDISEALAREVAYVNDEDGSSSETPEQRWMRVRTWVAGKITAQPALEGGGA